MSAGLARSTRTAQNLNSGIFPYGSSSSIVSTFAAASRQQNGMNTAPRPGERLPRTLSVMLPRRLVTVAQSSSASPSVRMSSGCMSTCGSPSIASSATALRVIVPVCQCSSRRPVVSTIGYSGLGSSAGGANSAGTILPRPRGKSSVNSTTVPSELAGSGHGQSLPSRPRCSYDSPR